MSQRLDEIDKRILYRLAADARNTSAPMIAEEVNVSAGTIRNRITQLEERGVIEGYHAAIDYERANGSLMNLLVCDTSVPDREKLAKTGPSDSGCRQCQGTHDRSGEPPRDRHWF